MSESIEPSYYEISLTSRQVVITFVILLTLVLAIFLSGVWVGKNGSQRLAEQGAPSVPADMAAESPEQLANMEEFKFFAEEGNGDSGSVLAGSRPDDSRATRTDDKPSERAPQQAPEPAPAPTPTRTAAQARPQDKPADKPAPQTKPPAKQTAESQATAPRPAGQTAQAGEGFVVQVFSTRDEAQARKVLRQLKDAGHRAFLSAVEVTGQTMYRVRVGPFNKRGDADQVAGKVRRQMKLDPWVTAVGN